MAVAVVGTFVSNRCLYDDIIILYYNDIQCVWHKRSRRRSESMTDRRIDGPADAYVVASRVVKRGMIAVKERSSS